MALLTGINRNIILLGIVSLITDISGEMIAPILPLFIVALGGSGIVVGLIGGLATSMPSLFNVVSGWWSDRIGKRKNIVVAGYTISAFSKLFFPFSTVWQHMLVLRPIERVGKGVRDAPRDAMIAQSVRKNIRGKGFGIHRMMDTAGAIIGTLIVFLIVLFWGFDFRAILMIAAVISFFVLIPLVLVKDVKTKPKKSELEKLIKGFPGDLKKFILISGVFGLANFTYMFFILRAQSLYTGFFGTIPILLYLLFNIVYALFAIPAGELSDRIGRKAVLGAGWLLFGLVCLGFILTTDLTTAVFLFVMYGLVFALIEGNARAMVADLASNVKGTALGTYHTVIAGSTLLSGIAAGFLWEIAPALTFVWGMGIAVLAVVLLVVLR